MTAQHPDAPSDESPDAARESSYSPAETNIGRRERIATTALGGALVALGLRRRALSGTAAAFVGGWLFYRGVTGKSSLYQALGTDDSSGGTRSGIGASAAATEVERSVTVGNSVDELYDRWRDPERMATVWGHVAEVTPTDDDGQRWQWRVNAPLGRTVEWETQVVEDRPGEVLRWESVEGAAVSTEGSVRFRPAPGDQGTEVTLHMRFDPPGGTLGTAAMELLGIVPDAVAGKALRRFKSLVETGEIPTLERNPSGRGQGDLI